MDRLNPLARVITANDLVNFTQFLDDVTDVPGSSPSACLPIGLVGVSGQELHLLIANPLDPEELIPAACTAKLSCSLPASQRGIHMSRLIQALPHVRTPVHDCLAFSKELLGTIRETQKASVATIELEFAFTACQKTPKSRLISPDPLVFLIRGSETENGTSILFGFRANNMSACPCTRAYSKYSRAPKLLERFSLEDANFILSEVLTFTHAQRGTITLLTDACDQISTSNLFDVLESSCHLVHDLLKRPDEHHLVEQAHLRPQFTEDVVRDVIDCFCTRFGAQLKATTRIVVESTLAESIHAHSIHAVIDTSLSELLTQPS